MKIQSIEITNYKAFLATEKLKIGGKNIFIYGENGSGKSSLYYALKDFFQSSVELIDFSALENIFINESKLGSGKIKVTFKPDGGLKRDEKTYHASTAGHDHGEATDTLIRDANKLKGFLTYKRLLVIHHLKKVDTINLFDLLVNGVLRHFKYSLTGGKELGELWAELKEEISKTTGRSYPSNKKRTAVNTNLKEFNKAFGELFKPDSPEYILKHARQILDAFEHNLEIKLTFPQVRPSEDYLSLENARVDITVNYAGKEISEPHLFLNEARLSAIAISIYLGMIKRHPQGIAHKILFLDDVFIGLDIANRLPLLKILDDHFGDYQIFIATYDKPWFEYAKAYLEKKSGWKTMEFYAQATNKGYEIPCIIDDQDLLTKAGNHLNASDYKAAAVYARSAFEEIIRNYCFKKRKNVTFRRQQKEYNSNHFWTAMKDDLDDTLVTDVQKYRDLVLNTFSHYNIEKHEIRTELEAAIQTIQTLKHSCD